MAKQLDKIHYSYREIDGYNKAFNFIFGVREVGKTTMMWVPKIYLKWKENKKPWIYLVRKSVEICEALITSIADTNLNKYTDDGVILTYTKGSFKDGITDVFINGELFFRIVSLNIDLRRIKLAVLKNIGGILIDEYIIDPRTKEKYLPNEAFKIKEAYTTWRRESDGLLKMYFLGNPYSLFNPMFLEWNVDVNKLKLGEFYVGSNFVIHWCKLSPELYEKLKQENPLYEEGSEYELYALRGYVKNDRNIPLTSQPQNFSLKFIFKVEDYYLGIYHNNEPLSVFQYWCSKLDSISKYRAVYCIDFADMVSRTQILTNDDRIKMARFKYAIQMNRVKFQSINDYYILMEVYKNI